jgi:acetoin utilization protein AcuC
MNIPVPQNFNDSEMSFVVDKLILPYAKCLNPDLVIVQAGTDCLHDDPQSNMILSNFSYWQTISKLKDISFKTLILGGGGYNPYITAKAWAGNWLVLNSKEKLLETNLNKECQNLLKSLSWKNSRVRNGIPNRWLDYWIDKKNSSLVRDEIKMIVDEIKRIKKL